MEQLKFEMTFSTHAVKVSQFSATDIRCWKYNNSIIDCEYFDNVEDAMEYIVTPLPTLSWYLEINDK